MTEASQTPGFGQELRGILRLLAPAPLASLMATVVGVVAISVLQPLLMLPPAFPAVLLIALPLAFALSIPVAFVLLPLAARLLRQLPATRRLALPLAGCVGGALVPPLAFRGTFSFVDYTYWALILAGACAGLASGLVYARKVRATDDRHS